MNINIETHTFPLKSPFAITGYTFTAANTVRVIINKEGYTGRGEATGIYYQDETPETMTAQLNSIIDTPVNLQEIQEALPRGGARNALDCAAWDLLAKRTEKSIWQLLNFTPRHLSTVATVSIDTPEAMAKRALHFASYPHLKIKLDNNDPILSLEAIRTSRPDATLIVDVNQGWNFGELKEYTPAAKKLNIAMIEQPLPRGKDEELEGYESAVPLGADESCLDVSEYEIAARRYDVINIKLDKCGGLTGAFKIVQMAARDNKKLMIGNMTGSSLSMAPAYVIGQFCQYIDLDGPLFLKSDVDNGLEYHDGGIVSIPNSTLWG